MRIALFLKAAAPKPGTVTYDMLAPTGQETFNTVLSYYNGELAKLLIQIAEGHHMVTGTGQEVLEDEGLIHKLGDGYSATVLGKNIAKAFKHHFSQQKASKPAGKKVDYAATVKWGPAKAKHAANNPDMQKELVQWVKGGQYGGASMGLEHAGWLSEDHKLTAAGSSAFYSLTGETASAYPPKKPASKVQLVPMKMWVKRKDGAAFMQTFWINPDDHDPPWDVYSQTEMHGEESKAADYEKHVERITEFAKLRFDIGNNTTGQGTLMGDAIKGALKYANEENAGGFVLTKYAKNDVLTAKGLGLIDQHESGEWFMTALADDVIANANAKGDAEWKKLDEQKLQKNKDLIEKYAGLGKLDSLVSMIDSLAGDNEYLKPGGDYDGSILKELTQLGLIEMTGEGDQCHFPPHECEEFLKLAKPALEESNAEYEHKLFMHAKKLVSNWKMLSDYMESQCEMRGIAFEVVPKAEWPETVNAVVFNKEGDGNNHRMEIDSAAVGGFVKVAGITFCIHAPLSMASLKYDAGLKLTEISTGLGAGAHSVPVGKSVDYASLAQAVIDKAEKGELAGLVKQKIAEQKGEVSSLAEHAPKVEFAAKNFDVEFEDVPKSAWMKDLDLEEGEPEPEPEPEDDDDEGGGGGDWDGHPFEVNGVTWDREVLSELDQWAGSPEMCKKVRSAMIEDVDGLPMPARYYSGQGHSGLRVAKMFDAHTHALREKKVWRTTEKTEWLNMQPGDFTPLGISSFTRVKDATNIAQYSSVGGTIRIEVRPTKGGTLKGISLIDIAEDNEDWKSSTDNVNRYMNEQEILLRAKALKIVSVDKAKRKVVCIAYTGKIPKGVVMKAVGKRPPILHWGLFDDLSRPLTERKPAPKKKAKGKKGGRK